MTETERSEEPDWLHVGAEVAVVSSNRHRPSVHLATVERIGKRDVVLDNGERFPVRRLQRNEGGGAWGWTVRLMSPTDPHVVRVQAEIERANLLSKARLSCDEFMRGRLNAFDTILALAPLAGVADQIAALDSKAVSS